MNDAAIRTLIREALGESPDAAGLAAGVEARLQRGGGEHPGRLARVLAAGLGLVLLAGLSLFWFGQRLAAPPRPVHHAIASPVPAAIPSAAPPANSAMPVPAADVAAAQLGAAAVPTPIGTTITSAGVAVTLLGVYADSEETVLFTHEEPATGVHRSWQLTDEQGIVNAAASGGRGLPGDTWLAVAAGLRSPPGTTASGTFVIGDLKPSSATPDPAAGNWRFAFSVPVQLADQLAVERADFQLGSWRVLIQSFRATPASLHLSTVITGAAPGALGPEGLTLTDPAGNVLAPSISGSAVTVPKQALTPANGQNSSVSYYWPRPAAGGEYTLHFAGGGGTRDIRVLVPATTSGWDGGKGAPSAVGSWPADLTLTGPVSGHIDSVAVSLCAGGMPGSATGYRTVLRAPIAGTVVTIQLALFAPDYSGPGTYPAYRDFGNGGGEGVTVAVEGGDYYAQIPSTGGAGSFTIRPGGGSGTFDGVRLKGNSGGELTLTGSWSCR
ncbi:MAG: hypothetical protein NVS9B1_21920 [Candidatus Dormibacteraceae bacterium]